MYGQLMKKKNSIVWGSVNKMKYQLNDGRIMSEDELKALYCSIHPDHNKDIDFDWWLYFAVERGTIKEVKE